MITYPAMLDVPRELVREVSRLLAAERRARGTRTGSRALTCWYQALLVLAWFRNQGDIALVGAGFGVSRATAYRYRDEVIDVLAARAPDLHDALERVAAQGWSHVVVDGKVFRTDRCAEITTSTRGETINAWYSGKHRAPGGNVHAVMRPDGLPVWVSDVVAGHRHDMSCARSAGVLGALYWAASQLRLPALADSGYEGAGTGVHTPIKQPGDGQILGPDNQAYNLLLRATRCIAERGFALLTGRWRA
uniref:transposase family protein n=1 Tax=Pseudonocardia sp. H11422 TaxID=2835866 RepID=UPI002931DC7F